jgi:hypothetical protein
VTDIKDWRKYHLDNVRSLDRAKALAAIEFLHSCFTPEVEKEIKEKATADPEWWCEHHLFGMMAVRNALRAAGHGEQQLGIDNLDDYAVGLVEIAVGVIDL